MYYGLYISAAGAYAQNQKVEMITNNLANVDTSGFKKELGVFEARESEAIERGYEQPGTRGANDVGGGVQFTETVTDFSLGTIRSTGSRTDFALPATNQFFEIERDGEVLLTRSGNFHFSVDGVLRTQDGDAVLGSGGAPVQIDPSLPWRTLPGGLISQGGDSVPMSLKQVENFRSLEKVGLNAFRPLGGELPDVPLELRNVQSGSLELSTVNPMQEMVEMIASSRAYETNIKMIQHHDGMTGSLVSRLLKA